MRTILRLEKERNYNSIDLFKLLMSFTVIAIHTNPIVTWTNQTAINVVMMIEEWAVPFFFIASGFFLQNGMDGKNQKEQQLRINRYIIKVLKMYCTWTLLSLPLTIYGYVISGNSIISCILSYIKYFFFVGKLYNSYHLWYLLALIYALLAIKFLYKGNKNIWVAFLISIIIFGVSELFSYAGERLDHLQGFAYRIVYIYQYVFNNGGVFKGMIYVVIGMMIATYRCCFDKWICLVGIVVLNIIKIPMQEYAIHWIRIVEVVFVFMFLLNIDLPESKIWGYCRKLSILIYLSHLIFYSLYTFVVIGRPNKLGFDSFIVTVFLSVINAALVIWISNKTDHKSN